MMKKLKKFQEAQKTTIISKLQSRTVKGGIVIVEDISVM